MDIQSRKITNLEVAEKIFKVLYLVHLILSFNAIYNISFLKNISSIIVIVLGVILLAIRIFQINCYWKRKDIWILSAFLLSFSISMLINHQYGFAANIKCLLWMCLYIYLLYLSVPDKGYHAMNKEFELISKVFIAVITCSNVINCMMFFTKFNKRIHIGGTSKRIGFFWSRLWGMYDDPNQGALFSVIVIIFSVYWLYQTKKKYYIAIIVVQLLYVVMSDSRTGAVCLSVGSAIIVYFLCMLKLRKKRILYAIFLAGLTLVGVFGGFKLGQKCVITIANKIDFRIEKKEYTDNSELQDYVEQIDEVQMERKELETDPSNRRFSIWESGMELFGESPVWGLGRYSYVDYAKENLPETYIVNNDFTDFGSLHNMLIEILVSQGIVGIVIFLGFIFYCLKIWIWGCKKIPENCQIIMIIWFIVLGINVLAAMIMPTLLYINSPATYIFWICLGYFSNVIRLNEQR